MDLKVILNYKLHYKNPYIPKLRNSIGHNNYSIEEQKVIGFG